VSVEVSNNGADLTSSGVQFVYERAPTVTGVELAEDDSDFGKGILLRVTGKHFVQSPSLRCRRGAGSGGMHGVSDARYVSSSLVYCRTEEESGKGKSAIEVSNNGQDFSSNAVSWLTVLGLGSVCVCNYSQVRTKCWQYSDLCHWLIV
jgi:hypothetical protein